MPIGTDNWDVETYKNNLEKQRTDLSGVHDVANFNIPTFLLQNQDQHLEICLQDLWVPAQWLFNGMNPKNLVA